MSYTVLDEPTSPRFSFGLGIHSEPIDVESSEDGIKKSLIIDMKDLVGDAVGNVRSVSPIRSSLTRLQMSIGPSYRDLVLAACVRPFFHIHRVTYRPCEGAMASSS